MILKALAYFWSCCMMWSVSQVRRNNMSDALETAPPSWIFFCKRLVAVLAHQILFKAEMHIGVRHQPFD